METILVIVTVITLVLVMLALIEVCRAHKNNTSVRNQLNTDVSEVRDDLNSDLRRLKSEVQDIRDHVVAHSGTQIGNPPQSTILPVSNTAPDSSSKTSSSAS